MAKNNETVASPYDQLEIMARYQILTITHKNLQI